MRVRADPLTVAVALGLLGPVATGGEGRLEIYDEDGGALERRGDRAATARPDAAIAADAAGIAAGVGDAQPGADSSLADILGSSSTVEYALLPEDEGGWPP